MNKIPQTLRLRGTAQESIDFNPLNFHLRGYLTKRLVHPFPIGMKRHFTYAF